MKISFNMLAGSAFVGGMLFFAWADQSRSAESSSISDTETLMNETVSDITAANPSQTGVSVTPVHVSQAREALDKGNSPQLVVSAP